jgi:4-hydroxybutyrate dehydrogenase / sulfolactaldehyde 3-reductase
MLDSLIKTGEHRGARFLLAPLLDTGHMMQNLSKSPDPAPLGPRTILFLGLGTMGLPMATNLVRAGFVVTGADSNAAAVARLVEAGGRAAENARSAASAAEAIVTMLPDDRAVIAVLGGEQGLIASARPGALIVEMSTTAPSTKIALGQLALAGGVDFVECPVGRTAEHAVAGTLALMAGGSDAALERAKPILAALGNELHVCGDVGAGSAMKLVNNALVACINAASIEALVAGRKAGLTLDLMMTVFQSTMAWNNALANGLPKKALRRDFAPGFMTALAHKDVGLALAMARELGVAMRQVEGAHALLGQALAQGYDRDDTPGSMLRVREAEAGVRLSL